MLRFVLADDEARALAAARPSTLRRVRGTAIAVGSDFVKSGWKELMRVGEHGQEHVGPRVTKGTPLWKGSATMSLEDARSAATVDDRFPEGTLASSLGGDEMPVSGRLEVFEDHLVMNVPESGQLNSFALRPSGPIRVVGVVDGNPGDAAFVLTLADGGPMVVRLGRARGLAAALGTVPPS